MALQLFVNEVDYTKYVVPGTIPILDDVLNGSKILDFALYPSDAGFVPVTEGERVRLISGQKVLFTGYVTQTPNREIVIPGYSGFQVSAQSDDWNYDQQITQEYVARYAGEIYRDLLFQASADVNDSQIPDGVFVPYFKVTSLTLAEALKELCDQIGWRWYILDDIAYLVNQNDKPYGYEINALSPDFNSPQFEVTASDVPTVSDASAIGYDEPTDFIQDNYITDGINNKFALSESVFGELASVPLFDDALVSEDETKWDLMAPEITFETYGLQVNGGSQQLGECALVCKNAFELGGELSFSHGKYEFTNLSNGLIGGLYGNHRLDLTDCLVGFWASANPIRTGLQAVVNGQKLGNTIVTAKNHAYELKTYVSADEIYRYNKVYRSVNGTFGGLTNESGAYVKLVVLDYDLGDPASKPVETALYEDRIPSIPIFATYALINSQGMNCLVTKGVVVEKLPPVRVMQNGILTTDFSVDSSDDGYSITVNNLNAGSLVCISYRKPAIASARLVNSNVAYKALTLRSSVRSSADCESLLQAYLSDHSQRWYEGHYFSNEMPLGEQPVTGRFIQVNYPNIGAMFSSIVRNSKIYFTSLENETGRIYTEFGFAPLMDTYSETDGALSIPALDFSTVPTTLPCITSVHTTAIAGNSFSVDCGRLPIFKYEARDGNGVLINQFSTQTFTIARSSRTDVVNIYELDAGATPHYSRYPTVIKAAGIPSIPATPLASSNADILGDTVYVTINLGDTTDLFGLELRASDNSTILFQQDTIKNTNLLASRGVELTVPGNVSRSVAYYAYTYNHRNEYSAVRTLTDTMPVPATPTVTVGFSQGLNVTLNLSVEARTDIIEETVEVSPDAGFSSVIITDLKNSQFGASTVTLPASGTYYARARKKDALGYGSYGTATFSCTELLADVVPADPAPGGAPTLSKGFKIATDGSIVCFVDVTMPAMAGDTKYRRIRAQIGTGNYVYYETPDTVYHIEPLPPNTLITVSYSNVSLSNSPSAWSTATTITTDVNANAPAKPTGLTAKAGFRVVSLSWTKNTEKDIDHYLIEFSSNNSTWTQVAKWTANYYTDVGDVARGVLNISTQYWYRVTAVNSSATASVVSNTATATTTAVGTTDFVVNTLDAAVVQANSIKAAKLDIADVITLGINGAGNTTLIEPGKILIGSGVPLSNWITGTTKIQGGEIAADTIKAYSLNIGARGIDVQGVFFYQDAAIANKLNWTGGQIFYVDNTGTYNSVTVASGSVTYSGSMWYIYWTIGGVALSTTTTAATAQAANTVVVCTYNGGTSFFPTYGRTVITGDYIGTRTISASNLIAGTITATEIATSAIIASKIAAGSITASKILMTDSTNLCSNPSGEDGLVTDGWTNSTWVDGVSLGLPAGTAALIQSTRDNFFGNWFPAKSGDVYRFAFDCSPSGGSPPSGDFTIGLHVNNDAGTNPLYYQSTYATVAGGGWQHIEGQVVVPAGVTKGRIWAQTNAFASFGAWYYRKVIVNKAASASLLVDGAITASKLNITDVINNGINAVGNSTRISPGKIQISGSGIDVKDITFETSENYLFDPGFEGNLNTLRGGASNTTNAALAHTGSSYLDINTGSYYATYLNNTSVDYVPVQAGDILEWGGWIYRTSGANVTYGIRLTINDYTTGLAFLNHNDSVKTGEWEYVYNSYLVTGSYNKAWPYVEAPTGAVARFDDAFVYVTRNGKRLRETLRWTKGNISYYDSAGTYQTQAVFPGGILNTGGASDKYIYWAIGGTSLQNAATAGATVGVNNILLGVWSGGSTFTPKYGTTIITGDYIQTGTIIADKIQFGLSANLCPNSDFSNGIWTLGTSGALTGWSADLNLNSSYTLSGITDKRNQSSANTPYIYQSPLDTTYNSGRYMELTSEKIPVQAGKRYIASVYSAAHRCMVDLHVTYYTSAGVYIGWTDGNGLNKASGSLSNQNNVEYSGGTEISGYKRIYVTDQAPATAGYCFIQIRKNPTLSPDNNSYGFFCRAMFEEAGAGQTTPSNWVATSKSSITQAGISANAIQTSNYTEDGSGNPTSGAKLSVTGTTVKIVAGGLQVGALIFTDYWVRLLQGIDGASTSRTLVWRGNNDTTIRGGAPNIDAFDIQARPYMSVYQLPYVLICTPTSLDDNLDSLMYAEMEYYVTTGSANKDGTWYQPIGSRGYYDRATQTHVNNRSIASYNYAQAGTYNVPGGTWASNVYPGTATGCFHILMRVFNAYGPSAQKWFVAASTTYTNFTRQLTAPSLGGGTPPPGGGGGGGGPTGGGGCPAPWVMITLASGVKIEAGDLYNGAQVIGVDEMTMLPKVGRVCNVIAIFAERYAIRFTDGRKSPEFSANHRLGVKDRGWVRVNDLRPGDVLMATKESVVERVESTGLGTVINFQVDGCNTYFADDLLNHNQKAAPTGE